MIADVSATGISIQSGEEYPIGAHLRIQGQRLRQNGPVHTMEFVVVRKSAQNSGKYHNFYGCRFENMPSDEQDRLFQDIFTLQALELRSSKNRRTSQKSSRASHLARPAAFCRSRWGAPLRVCPRRPLSRTAGEKARGLFGGKAAAKTSRRRHRIKFVWRIPPARPVPPVPKDYRGYSAAAKAALCFWPAVAKRPGPDTRPAPRPRPAGSPRPASAPGR